MSKPDRDSETPLPSTNHPPTSFSVPLRDATFHVPTLTLILRDLVYSAFRLCTACDRLSWEDTTVGDRASADAGVEGKAPGVVFDLDFGDVWVLLVVAIVRALASRCTYATSVAIWAGLQCNQPTPAGQDDEDLDGSFFPSVFTLNECMWR